MWIRCPRVSVAATHTSPLSMTHHYWISADLDTAMHTVVRLQEQLLVSPQPLNIQNCACVCRRYHTSVSDEIAIFGLLEDILN